MILLVALEALATVIVKSSMFWNLAQRSPSTVNGSQRYMYPLAPPSKNKPSKIQTRMQMTRRALKLEALCSSEMRNTYFLRDTYLTSSPWLQVCVHLILLFTWL
jgi:hypothetical protein